MNVLDLIPVTHFVPSTAHAERTMHLLLLMSLKPQFMHVIPPTSLFIAAHHHRPGQQLHQCHQAHAGQCEWFLFARGALFLCDALGLACKHADHSYRNFPRFSLHTVAGTHRRGQQADAHKDALPFLSITYSPTAAHSRRHTQLERPAPVPLPLLPQNSSTPARTCRHSWPACSTSCRWGIEQKKQCAASLLAFEIMLCK